MLSLGEELLLLALHDKKGTLLPATAMALRFRLSGTVLMELMLNGRLQIDRNRMKVFNSTPTGDEILDEALAMMTQIEEDRNAEYWVSELGRGINNLKERLLTGLVNKGILQREKYRILGIIPSYRYLQKDSKVKQALKNRIFDVIIDGATPDPRMVMLIGLVDVCDLTDEIVAREQRKKARIRVKEIIRSDLISRAIFSTVAKIQALILAAGTSHAGSFVEISSSETNPERQEV